MEFTLNGRTFHSTYASRARANTHTLKDINTVMVAKFTQGNEKLEDVIKWAEKELEGTLRA